MRKAFYLLGLIGLVAVLYPGCKKTGFTGQTAENKAPETHTIIDTIIRTGSDRFNSEVHIRWWGDDPDGYLTGYEFAFDNGPWHFTTLNDSVFILSPPPGLDTVDFTFKVRAIDNDGLVDPTPASVEYPIKNSQPTVAFVPGTENPTKSFPILRFFWKADDPDGQANLNKFELVWNDTSQTPVEVDINTSGAIFEALSMQSGPTETNIYRNNNDDPENGTIPGFQVGDTNRLYIRVIDNSDASSDWVSSYPVYVQPILSDVLVVNATTTVSGSVEDFYFQQIANQGIALIDTVRYYAKDGADFSERAPDNLTQRKIFAEFNTIIWFSNSASTSLSVAQRTTTDFFDQGGKMLMAIYVSSTFDEQSQFFDFTPVEELVETGDTTLQMNNGASIDPLETGWPTLSSTAILGVVKPIIVSIGAIPLYEAELLARDSGGGINPWTGESVVMAKQEVNGQTNFVISTLELQNLDGNTNIDQFFQKVLKDEFGL